MVGLLNFIQQPVMVLIYRTIFTILLFFSASNTNAIHYDSNTFYSSQTFEEQQTTRCQPVDSTFCNLPSYSTVHPFNNSFGHNTPHEALASLHKHLLLISFEDCKDKIQLFLCALYVPVCVDNSVVDGLLYPCKDDCIAAREVCKPYYLRYTSGWPQEWNCEKFKSHSEDPLCVIDNNRVNRTLHTATSISIPTSHEIPSKFDVPSEISPDSHPSNETVCDKDLFDCQLRDPTKKLGAYCIEQSYVCNGVEDCIRNGTLEGPHGMDEKNCPNKCTEYQLNCGDNKCISRFEICDGKVDCSSGIDEQECYDYLTGLIQSILCIVAMFIAIYLIVRRIKVDDNEDGDIDDDKDRKLDIDAEHYHDKLRYDSPSNTPHSSSENRPTTPIHHKNQVPDTIVDISHSHSHRQIYNEPAYSTASRTDFYERVAIGGRSGASSVYTSYQSPQRSLIDIERHSLTPPPPPPPTPAPTPLYANLIT